MKTTRAYKIKNLETGQFLIRVAANKKRSGWVYYASFDDECEYLNIEQVNNIIEGCINHKFFSDLDKCEIETYEVSVATIKGQVKMKNVRARLEQTAMMESLRGII